MKTIFFSFSLFFFFVNCNNSAKEYEKINRLKLNAVSNTISQNKNQIIYSCWDKSVKIFDMENKSIIYSKKVAQICYSKPIVRGNKIFYPDSDNSFVCVNLSNGSVLWKLNINGRCSNFDFIDDKTIVASINNFGLSIINTTSGKVLYDLKYDFNNSKLPDLSPWKISFDDKNFYASNWQGSLLSCFNKKDGKLNWGLKANKFGYSGRSILINNKIFIGINEFYKGGSLLVVNPSNGKILLDKACNYEERVEPIVYKNAMYFYTYDGYLNKYDLKTDSLTKLLRLTDENDLSANQMFLDSDVIFFSDNSFNLNKFYINKNKIEKINKTEKLINWVLKFDNEDYFIY